MRITKLGHCCLLLETDGMRILTDPGSWTVEAHKSISDLDAVLITHEHGDHLHLDSVVDLLEKNPRAEIIANSAVSLILQTKGLAARIVEHDQEHRLKGRLAIRGFGQAHADMHASVVPVLNTGYLIGGSFFYPGDALTKIAHSVEILALPVAGPWLTIGQAIDYGLGMRPKAAFPVHDGNLRAPGVYHNLPLKAFSTANINFLLPEIGKPMDF